jgi:hypothetical protein
MLGAPVAQLPDPICDASPRQASEPVESEWRTCAVSHQPLAAQVIIAGDCDAGVQIEAVVFLVARDFDLPTLACVRAGPLTSRDAGSVGAIDTISSSRAVAKP